MQDPPSVVDRERAASLRIAGACRSTAAPWDSLRADSRDVPVVSHRRRTWAALGSWPWGSAGLWDAETLSCEDRTSFSWLRASGRPLTVERCPPPLLSPLVEVTAGAHEAAHHGGDDGHKQEDGGGDARYGGWAVGGVEKKHPLLHVFSNHIFTTQDGAGTLSRRSGWSSNRP